MDSVGVVIGLVWLASAIAAIDAIRRPKTAWVAADRNRGFWISALVMSAVLLFPSVIFLPGYLFVVLPSFGSASRTPSNVSEFRRQ